MKHPHKIFIVGPMGAGKTTIGRQLAEDLGLAFYDSDQEIEKRTGVNIPTIFDIEGESGFRRRESAMLDELTQHDDIVLATGGGAVLAESNRQHLAARGLVIYLQADIDALVQRTRRDRNRPLLQNGDPRKKLEELMAQRDPLYRAVADIVEDTGNGNVRQTVRHLLQQIRQTDTRKGS